MKGTISKINNTGGFHMYLLHGLTSENNLLAWSIRDTTTYFGQKACANEFCNIEHDDQLDFSHWKIHWIWQIYDQKSRRRRRKRKITIEIAWNCCVNVAGCRNWKTVPLEERWYFERFLFFVCFDKWKLFSWNWKCCWNVVWTYPLSTPSTKFNMKNDPRTINGTKYTQLYRAPSASFV